MTPDKITGDTYTLRMIYAPSTYPGATADQYAAKFRKELSAMTAEKAELPMVKENVGGQANYVFPLTVANLSPDAAMTLATRDAHALIGYGPTPWFLLFVGVLQQH